MEVFLLEILAPHLQRLKKGRKLYKDVMIITAVHVSVHLDIFYHHFWSRQLCWSQKEEKWNNTGQNDEEYFHCFHTHNVFFTTAPKLLWEFDFEIATERVSAELSADAAGRSAIVF